MLNSWKAYLFNNFQNLQRIEDFGLLYEKFISEFPEFRKQWGVYYTPEYIVEYIVKNTVGKIIENKTPQEISKIKILDPSCGSGSFLLGAYQYLLDYHLKYYHNELKIKNYELGIENNKQNLIHNSKFIIHNLPLTPDGNLSSQEKKRILLNNIFGVDIDTQAVEVSKLSLLLKALEGETETSIQTSLQIFHERVLPTLDNNIQSGNSLISPDFYNEELFLTPKEERKINVFDWKSGFPEVFKQGGFDCVIGNPPYVNIVNVPKIERNYLQKKFTITKNKIDLYSFFIETIIKNLLKDNALFGYIVSNSWLTIDSFQPMRELIFSNGNLLSIVEMPNGTFKDAQVVTVIIIYSKSKTKNHINVLKFDNGNFVLNNSLDLNRIMNDTSYSILINAETKEFTILDKIEKDKSKINEFLHFSRGVKTSNDKKFVLEKKENNECFKLLRGKNIQKYFINYSDLWLWYRPDLMKEKVGCLTHTKEVFFVPEKIILQGRSGGNLIAYYDRESFFVLDTAYFSKTVNLKNHSLKYFVAILNSRLINFWYGLKFKNPTVSGYELHQIPVKSIDFKLKTEKQQHDHLVKLVENMLELNKRLQTSNIQSEKEQLQRRIEHIDKEIDKRVYELYQITEQSDIEIIEGRNA